MCYNVNDIVDVISCINVNMHQEVDLCCVNARPCAIFDLWPLLCYNVHDIVPLQMMSKMGGLGGMDNPMGVSVNPNSLSSNIVVTNLKSLFSMYLSEPDSLSLNKSIDSWRFYSSCSSLFSSNSSSFLLLLLINHLLMVTLKFYPVGAHYEIGGPLFSLQLLHTIL